MESDFPAIFSTGRDVCREGVHVSQDPADLEVTIFLEFLTIYWVLWEANGIKIFLSLPKEPHSKTNRAFPHTSNCAKRAHPF